MLTFRGVEKQNLLWLGNNAVATLDAGVGGQESTIILRTGALDITASVDD